MGIRFSRKARSLAIFSVPTTQDIGMDARTLPGWLQYGGGWTGVPSGVTSREAHENESPSPHQARRVPLERRIRWLEATIEIFRRAGEDVKYEEGLHEKLLTEAGRRPYA
jgi:hypothetical protein